MNLHTHLLIGFAALAASMPTICDEDVFRAEWVATCKFGSTDFSIQFKSKSGESTEDDQVVTLQWGKSRTTTLPLQPALFVSATYTSDSKNYCREIGAFEWPNDKLLLLIPQNYRPSSDHLVALVIDAKTGALVQNVGDLGTYWDGVLLLKQRSGFRILLERARYQDATSSGEFSTPDWMRLYEDRGRLTKKWETARK